MYNQPTRSATDTAAITDKLVSFDKSTSGNPAIDGQYGVLRRNGKPTCQTSRVFPPLDPHTRLLAHSNEWPDTRCQEATNCSRSVELIRGPCWAVDPEDLPMQGRMSRTRAMVPDGHVLRPRRPVDLLHGLAMAPRHQGRLEIGGIDGMQAPQAPILPAPPALALEHVHQLIGKPLLMPALVKGLLHGRRGCPAGCPSWPGWRR